MSCWPLGHPSRSPLGQALAPSPGPRAFTAPVLCPQLPGCHRAGHLRRAHLAHREHWRDRGPGSGPSAGQEHNQKGKVSGSVHLRGFTHVIVLSAEVWPRTERKGGAFPFLRGSRGFSKMRKGTPSSQGRDSQLPGERLATAGLHQQFISDCLQIAILNGHLFFLFPCILQILSLFPSIQVRFT